MVSVLLILDVINASLQECIWLEHFGPCHLGVVNQCRRVDVISKTLILFINPGSFIFASEISYIQMSAYN